MRLLIGIIIYQTPLSGFLKHLAMLLKQLSLLSRWVTYKIVILDNDRGVQLETFKQAIIEKFGAEAAAEIEFMSGKNVGFGSGHNKIFEQMTQKAYYDYYVCLNPDGIPHPDLFRMFLDFAARTQDNGLYEARQFPIELSKAYNPETGETDWVSGCCLMIPSKIFRALEGFDPIFFLYMEDVDLSWRARLADIPCYTVPEAYFMHFRQPREADKVLKRHLVTSGYMLAVKYKNDSYVKAFRQQLEAIIESDKLAEIDQQLKKKSREYRGYKTMPFMHFDQGYNFSMRRW